MVRPRFHDSLPTFVRALAPELSAAELAASVILRDASGRLCLFTGKPLGGDEEGRLDNLVRPALGPYAAHYVAVQRLPGSEPGR